MYEWKIRNKPALSNVELFFIKANNCIDDSITEKLAN